MLKEPTVEKLRSMGLAAMADAWQQQQAQPDLASLAFDERLALLVDAEWVFRENRRLARALSEAKLKLGQACLEDIDYSARRELDKGVIRQLASCRWVIEHQNVLVTGPTGTGKTYLGAHWRSRRAGRAIAPSTAAPRASSPTWRSPAPTARTRACSPSSRAPTCWSSMTGRWPRSRTTSVATCSRCSRIATAPGRPS